MGTLSQHEQLQKMKEIRDDFDRYCKGNLKIKTKSGDIIPLELKPIQRIIADMVIDDLKNERPIRYIILKARQEGVSTLIEALILL